MQILKVKTKERAIGDIGERLAAKYLKKHGYKILRKNYVVFDSEIDIIAENKTTLSFIEVKTRTEGSASQFEMRPASAVTPDKQRKIIRAAKYYAAGHPRKRRLSLDIIEVYLTKDKKEEKIIHLENAFNINTSREPIRKAKA